jgi:hypothetical protein
VPGLDSAFGASALPPGAGGPQSGRWSGCLERPPILTPSIEIAGALGQTHASSAAPYVIEAEQKRSAKRVMKALERSGRR